MSLPVVPSVLDSIIAAAWKRVEVARERRSLADLERRMDEASNLKFGISNSPHAFAAPADGVPHEARAGIVDDGRAGSPIQADPSGRVRRTGPTIPSPAESGAGSPTESRRSLGEGGSPADVDHVATARPAFMASLQQPGIRVIAECKRRSPSKGVLRPDYDPVAIADQYATAGAAAISILTEPGFFDGALDHLVAVHAARPEVPLLRKDFTVDEYQIAEAALAGASAVLLIVAALEQPVLVRLLAYAAQAGVDVLTEVHDENEAHRAMDAGATIIGVNNRNLKTLEVSIDTAHRVAPIIASARLRVAESGLRTGADLASLHAAGYGAFLIGERFMTEANPGAALAAVIADARTALEAQA